MKNKPETASLTPVLCTLCQRQGPSIMMLGECEACGKPTSSAAYRYCGECSTEQDICCQCGEPLDSDTTDAE